MLLAAGLVLDGTTSLRLPAPGEAAAFGYLGAVVTAAAFFLWYDALRRLGADRAGLFAGLVPVGALLTTVALGLARVGPADVIGALLVTAGVAVGLRRPGARPRPRRATGHAGGRPATGALASCPAAHREPFADNAPPAESIASM
jgi:drug/metabolite transporter (DMT)-like permease